MVTLKGFEVGDQLHRGDRCRVFRARTTSSGTPVVLKLPAGDHPAPGEVARWRAEHAILRELVGVPGVIQISDYDERAGVPLLVLEDIRGTAVGEIATGLGLRRTLEIAIRTAEALGQIHEAGIIHKHITPSNIVVSDSGEVRLIDFAIASRLPRENQTLQSPTVLDGSLAYLAPEQTGRMNRTIDYRTDFYSLGATLFELLSGQRAFPGDDPLELVHAHIARRPPALHDLAPDIPEALSAVVEKLLSKAAEQRYQSAYGLAADLRECARQLDTTGRIENLSVGGLDVPRTLVVTENLYGREAEVADLLSAFDRVSHGSTELLLVTGYSGVGKTRLVAEVHKPITTRRGYFAAGKSEQYRRDLPYGAFIAALGSLAAELRQESQADREEWKAQLVDALAPLGRVLVDLVPAFDDVLGELPVPPPAPAGERGTRLAIVVQALLGVLAARGRPVVFFLDDLQWMDAASLGLLKSLLSSHKADKVLFVGAYRDNEVDDAHPLHLVFGAIRKAGVSVNTIALHPLRPHDLRDLVKDTLRCDSDAAAELATLLTEKTHGNPFFVNQLLLQLYRDGFLRFDPTGGAWQWDLAGIRRAELTDNVLEFMVRKLRQLPPECLRLLQLAACIGSRFSEDVLISVAEASADAVVAALWAALKEGMVLPLHDRGGRDQARAATYRFLHDRVQQASYVTIPDEDRPRVHARIGHLLRKSSPRDPSDDELFDILEHYRVGFEFLESDEERLEIARLGLLGGQRAKNSLAYEAARKYLELGLRLLPAGQWSDCYELTHALHFENAQCQYLAGHFERALEELASVLDHTRTRPEKANVYQVLSALHEQTGRFREALETGLEALRLFDIEIAEIDDPDALDQLINETLEELSNVVVEDLLEAPPLADPDKLTVASVFAWVPTYHAGSAAFAAMQTSAALFSLRHGNSGFTPLAFVRFGIVMAERGAHEEGFELGRIGFRLAQRQGVDARILATQFSLGTFLGFRCEHFAQSAEYLAPPLEDYLRSGNIMMSSWTVHNQLSLLVLSGHNLVECHSEAVLRRRTAEQAGLLESAAIVASLERFCANLTGLTKHESTYSDDDGFDEEAFESALDSTRSRSARHCYYYKKSLARYLFGNHAHALAALEKAESVLDSHHGTMASEEQMCFIGPLVLAGATNPGTPEADAAMLKIKAGRRRLKALAKSAPMNYQHKLTLLDAEIARLDKQLQRAETLYDDAIQQADDEEFRLVAAVAAECAGRWYLSRGRAIRATAYLTSASQYFAQWGAYGKVRQLKARYGEFVLSTVARERAQAVNVDMLTVTRALQAISSEIRLEQLLATLTKVLIANAGAERGFVLLRTRSELQVYAEKASSTHDVRTFPDGRPIEEHDGFSARIVRRVEATSEEMVLANAAATPDSAGDLHIMRSGVKSVLCLPAIHQGSPIGVVYLENNLIEGCFTAERLEILRVLVSQMAVSVENAGLYKSMEETVAIRTHEALQKDLALTAAVQSLFLPGESALDSERYNLRGYYWPASVCSGDWWWYDHNPDQLRILLGDVTGHGAASAMITACVASCYRILANRTGKSDLEDVFRDLDAELRDLAHGEYCMTMSAMVLEDDHLRWYTAAALPIMVITEEGKIDVLTGRGSPLGSLSGSALGICDYTIRPGSRVALFTDGLVELERRPGSQLGLRWMQKALSRTRHSNIDEAIQTIVSDLRLVAGDRPLDDDISLVLLDFNG